MCWEPQTEIKTYRGIQEESLMTRNFMNRRVFLTGEIMPESADRIVSQLLFLDAEGEDPVDILMHSPGGEVNSGLMIYDVLRGMRCEVNLWCLGTCASMAAILLASGKKGHRFILPHGQVMIHEPQVLSGIGGSASSIRNLSDSILRTREITNKILAEHTGHTLAEINDATAYDHYMGAGEAVEFGICDEIRTRIGS